MRLKYQDTWKQAQRLIICNCQNEWQKQNFNPSSATGFVSLEGSRLSPRA